MAPIPNPTVIYAKIPTEYPVPGEHLIYEPSKETIDLDTVPLNGGVLVKTLALSIDPYMRGRMRDPKIPSYSPAMEVGKPGEGGGVVRVVRSESEKYKPGDHFAAPVQWKAYQVIPAERAGEVIQNPTNLPWPSFLTVAGGTARTAFYSLRTFGKLKAGETIFVTTAAGGVGSIVVQLAKLAGLRVIGSTGDDEKVKYLKEELGVEVAFNYKKESVWEVLKEHGPIDLYFDNVGGEQLDAAILNATQKGSRFIMCGYASEYNLPPGEEPYGLKNGRHILAKSITMNGFIVSNLIAEQGLKSFNDEYLPLVRERKVTQREQKTIGLENLAKGFVELLKGENKGKAIIIVVDE